MFDYTAVDRRYIYVDLAHQDTAELDREHPNSREAIVCLSRTSCNDADIQQFGLARRAQTFNWQLTGDAASTRATPASKSPLSKGGAAYVQAYNSIKTMFASTDRTTENVFGDPAFRLLGFTQSTLSTFMEMARHSAVDPKNRQRAVKAFKEAIARVHDIINADYAAVLADFSSRQEYRSCWDMFMEINRHQREHSCKRADGSTNHDRQPLKLMKPLKFAKTLVQAMTNPQGIVEEWEDSECDSQCKHQAKQTMQQSPCPCCEDFTVPHATEGKSDKIWSQKSREKKGQCCEAES